MTVRPMLATETVDQIRYEDDVPTAAPSSATNARPL